MTTDQAKPTELLPCPFCGAKPRLIQFDAEWFMQCRSCGASVCGHLSKSAARKLWQQRIKDIPK